jgi:hypothetical protein
MGNAKRKIERNGMGRSRTVRGKYFYTVSTQSNIIWYEGAERSRAIII